MNEQLVIFVMVNLVFEIFFDEVLVVGVYIVGIGCSDFLN